MVGIVEEAEVCQEMNLSFCILIFGNEILLVYRDCKHIRASSATGFCGVSGPNQGEALEV